MQLTSATTVLIPERVFQARGVRQCPLKFPGKGNYIQNEGQ